MISLHPISSAKLRVQQTLVHNLRPDHQLTLREQRHVRPRLHHPHVPTSKSRLHVSHRETQVTGAPPRPPRWRRHHRRVHAAVTEPPVHILVKRKLLHHVRGPAHRVEHVVDDHVERAGLRLGAYVDSGVGFDKVHRLINREIVGKNAVVRLLPQE